MTAFFPSFFRTSVLFVSISFIVLMIISLVWLIFYYIQRFRYMQAKDQQSVSELTDYIYLLYCNAPFQFAAQSMLCH